MTSWQKIMLYWVALVPAKPIGSVVEWARRHVRLVGSARSEAYDPDITPWNKEPLECADNGTRKMTFIKPIQGGGSVAGEIAICYWASTQHGGDIQYNWQSDKKADERWPKRVEKIMKACKPLVARTPLNFKWNKGLLVFPWCNFTMQGVFSDNAVASDSVRFQVNEEIHDNSATSGWADEGRLEQAYGRTTAYWNSVIFNISNAGKAGGQLHKAFLSGTQQRWQVKCPGCGQYHVMRMRWEDQKPELGGLRYDTIYDVEKLKLGRNTLDWSKVQPTIRYQMPCGYIVRDNVRERRALSLSGCYGEPENKSALLTERSYTLEAVSVDYISWISLIQQKESARESLAWGKGDAWWSYLRERECQFTSDADRPVMNQIVKSAAKKDRAGLAEPKIRFGAADFQQGKAARHELPHNWHVIVDVKVLENGKLHVLIVSEGRESTDANLTDVIDRHKAIPSCIALDSGWDTMRVYTLAMDKGFYCVKDEPTLLFSGHEDGSRKIYSPPAPLHAMINQGPKFEYVPDGKGGWLPDAHEPMFIRVSKIGMMDRLAWMRTSPNCIFDVPSDVSEDFVAHMDAWQIEEQKKIKTNETERVWVQRREDDHLMKCLCYIAVLMEDAGLFGGMITGESK